MTLLILALLAQTQSIPSAGKKWYVLGAEKGALYTSSSANDYKLTPGVDGLCLLTDSAETVGLRWGSCSGGAGGAPTDALYWVGAAHGGLSAEQNLGALSTGLIINTAGVPSAYAGATCTNQFPRVISASGAATCASVSLSADTTGTLTEAKGGTGAGALTCSAGQALTSNGTLYACTSTLTASDVVCSGTCVSDAEILAVATTKLTGTITDAQLANNYSGVGTCSQKFVRVLNDNSAPTCEQVVLDDDVTGTLRQELGGTGSGVLTCGAGQVLTSSGAEYSCVSYTGTISPSQIITTNLSGDSRTFLRGDGVWARAITPPFPSLKKNPFLPKCNAVRKFNCQ